MSSMPYVKFYSESFLTGVSGLTNEECGMYIKLLCLQHQSGHLDERTICLACAIKSISEIPYVMKKFEQDEDGLYFNSRMEVEIQKAEKYVESRIENGKNGGRPKKKDAENNPSKNHMDTIKEPYAEPYENHTDTYRALDISYSSSSLEESYKNEGDKNDRDNKQDNNMAKKETESIIDETIAYLNSVADRGFKPKTESIRKFIRARIGEGYTFNDFKYVIDNQWAKWKGTDMAEYMRPSTLFCAEKFPNYINAPDYSKVKPKPTGEPKGGVTRITPDFFTKLAKEHKQNDT